MTRTSNGKHQLWLLVMGMAVCRTASGQSRPQIHLGFTSCGVRRTQGPDTFQGQSADDTGVTAVYLGPQLSFTWTSKLSAQLGADLPVSIDNTALQTVPDYRVRGGLTWHF